MPPSNPISPFLERQDFVVVDGGLATELERRGADLSDPLWSARVLIDAPESIRQVHLDYLEAGADVVTTASYQATFEGFARRGIDKDGAAALMRRSVELAVSARDAFWSKTANRIGRMRPLVAASIGPYGAFLADGAEYRGNYDLGREELAAFHRERLAVLATTDADLLACETIPCRIEGEALVALLAEFPARQAWLSFSCRDERSVSHGEPLADCVALARDNDQIVAAGLNCTAPELVTPLLRSAAPVAPCALLAYPNSGETWNAERRSWESPISVDAGGSVAEWRDAGARLIGGCCRTGPRDVRRIRAALSR